jgi:hypothetical protein
LRNSRAAGFGLLYAEDMTAIELSDEQAAALMAKAAAQGLSLEEWLQKLATEPPARPGSLQLAADIVLEEMRKVPADLVENPHCDGASEHDHYLYGWPKKRA